MLTVDMKKKREFVGDSNYFVGGIGASEISQVPGSGVS